MIKYENYRFGAIGGYVYAFRKKGDCIPKHCHRDHIASHNIIVLQGSVKVFGPGFEVILTQGAIFDVNKEIEHAIMALEDNTRTIHLFDHCPPDFEATGGGTYP